MSKKNVRLTRKTADRLIKEFLERVEEVNKNDDLMYVVEKSVVFGSYLTDKERLGDLDLAVVMKRRKSDKDYGEWSDERVALARSKGKRFQFPEDLWWPKKEVRLLLTANSKGISLHDLEDIEIGDNYKVIYEQ